MRLTPDYPPVWLATLAVPGWIAGRLWPHGPDWMRIAGWTLVLAGLALLLLAAARMLARRTTLDPHGAPGALVTDGVFAWSRNPIYLADALILTGLCAAFGAPLAALVLTPAFVAIVTQRFIRPEETRLAAAFAAYAARTRRWL